MSGDRSNATSSPPKLSSSSSRSRRDDEGVGEAVGFVLGGWVVPKGGEAYREAHAVATASHHGRGNSEEFEMGVVESVQRGGKATENRMCVCVYVCIGWIFLWKDEGAEREGWLRILNIRCWRLREFWRGGDDSVRKSVDVRGLGNYGRGLMYEMR